MKTQTERPIQLQWDGGNVVITPEDEDRFVRESSWAVSACQNKLALERFIEQFKSEFLATIHAWCVRNAERVRAAFVPIETNGQLQLFIVTRAGRYDFDLSDSLASLEMSLFEKSWPCDALQIPDGGKETLLTFFDPERSIQVYGNGTGASEEV